MQDVGIALMLPWEASGSLAAPATGLQALASPALTRNPHHESSGKRPSFPLSSSYDDRDNRTRAEGTKAKRRGEVYRLRPSSSRFA